MKLVLLWRPWHLVWELINPMLGIVKANMNYYFFNYSMDRSDHILFGDNWHIIIVDNGKSRTSSDIFMFLSFD